MLLSISTCARSGVSGSDTITYPLVEFRDFHCDQFGLLVSLQLEEACLLFHDLAEQESEQLFVVSRLREILPEALLSSTKDPVSNLPPIKSIRQRTEGTRTR